MATEYISREAAIELLTTALDDDWEPEYAQDRLSEIPAADVRPVAEGHWLTWEEMFPDQNPRRKNNLGVFCSACKKHADNMTDFCPNCGADMRKLVEIDQVKEGDT